jgi:uncharacterized membrane protein
MARASPFRQGGFRPYGRPVMVRPLYMDAEIRPQRSLSQRGFIVLIAVVTLANCASAAVFLAMGATFVPIFLGIDLVAVIVAFLVSFHAQKTVERVQVSARDVRVVRETPRDQQLIWESPTAFTRVALATQDDRAVDLRLAISGREVQVAAALSPAERGDFARALEKAIWEARRDRG